MSTPPASPHLRKRGAHPGCASPEAGALLDELLALHAESMAQSTEADKRAWVEGGIASRLHTENQLSASVIAAELNKRTSGRVAGRHEFRARWVQRLIEVHTLFATPESRTSGATWKTHAMAVDLARIRLDLRGKKIEKLTDEAREQWAVAAGKLVSEAVQQAGAERDPERWLGGQCREARQAARPAMVGARPSKPASDATTHTAAQVAGERAGGGTQELFEQALRSVRALVNASPTPEQLAELRDALIGDREAAA